MGIVVEIVVVVIWVVPGEVIAGVVRLSLEWDWARCRVSFCAVPAIWSSFQAENHLHILFLRRLLLTVRLLFPSSELVFFWGGGLFLLVFLLVVLDLLKSPFLFLFLFFFPLLFPLIF